MATKHRTSAFYSFHASPRRSARTEIPRYLSIVPIIALYFFVGPTILRTYQVFAGIVYLMAQPVTLFNGLSRLASKPGNAAVQIEP